MNRKERARTWLGL